MVFIDIDKSNYNKFAGTNENKIIQLDSFLHGKKVFALIFMEGCGPCNAVRPEWAKLKNVLKDYVNRDDIAIVSIDKDLLEKTKYVKHHPTSFPTLRYITNRGNTIENYEDSNIRNKDRSIDSFVEWIKSKETTSKKSKSKTFKKSDKKGGKTKKRRGRKWSAKYKRSINCNKPKGFSQRQYCKYGRNK